MKSGTTLGGASLLRDERVLWRGRSSRILRFGLGDIPITLFMLVWTGLPASSALAALNDDGDAPGLFVLPFLLIGAYMLFGRFPVDLWLRSRQD